MITQKFLDKLNNSEIGKTVRLDFFECSDKVLKKIYKLSYENGYTEEETRRILNEQEYREFPDEIFEFIKENNTFLFDIHDIHNIGIIKTTLCIDVLELNGGLNEKSMKILSEIVEELKINTLYIYNISGNVKFGDLKVKNLGLQEGDASEVDFSKLSHTENLIVFTAGLKDLETIKKMKKLREISIFRGKNDSEIDILEILEMKNLESVCIKGQETNEKQIKGLLELPNIRKIDIYSKENRLIQSQHPPIITNIDELKLVLKSNYFDGDLLIFYAGTEPIPAGAFNNQNDRKIELAIVNPLVLDDNFCKAMNDNPNFHVFIEEDAYASYTLAEISAINKKIRQIKEGISPDVSDLEKAIYLYSKLGYNIEYDQTGCDDNEGYTEERSQITRSLKGALLENKGICYGFALTFKVLAKELGMECNIIIGKIYSGMTLIAGHAWNQIKVDGKWYNIDLTGDRGWMRNNSKTQFFMLDDETMNNKNNETRRNIYKIKCVRDYINKDGELDYLGYNAAKEWQSAEKCRETCNREIIEALFKKYNGGIGTTSSMVAQVEEASTDVTKGDIISTADEIGQEKRQKNQLQNIDTH